MVGSSLFLQGQSSSEYTGYTIKELYIIKALVVVLSTWKNLILLSQQYY